MKKKEQQAISCASQLRTAQQQDFIWHRTMTPGIGQEAVYRQMRSAIPILDAAIGKLVRLTGGFHAECENKAAEKQLQQFLRTVPVGYGQYGIENFLMPYLDSLLMFGRALGEMMIPADGTLLLRWADVTKFEILPDDGGNDVCIGVRKGTQLQALPRQKLLLFSTWNADTDHPYGTSLFYSMPFLTDILMKIYRTVGTNWERAGNVRYAVTYKPTDEADMAFAAERAKSIASEWSNAMQEARDGSVRDFVSVGDVQIRVIGSDGQILDSEVPVRQILEQLVAKTGLPPFLFGLSWAATERMAAQQTDLLTSELWAIRRSVQPVLEKICRTWLQLHGCGCEPEIVWDEISLQDIEMQAHAALYLAQADRLLKEQEEEV
ncbi:MAG: serine/threonine protein phosphatase [Clostridia bacterium]|nr:serine/threonine protein phosphatase [Clostridia bacterium]